MDNNRQIYFGRVLDNNDPKGLGRLRVLSNIEIETYVDNIPDSDKWGPKDSLVYLPLLPTYLWQIPSNEEYVNIFYTNLSERYGRSKFYIQGSKSRPWNNRFESYNNTKSVLDSGENLKMVDDFIDPLTGKVRITLEGVYPKPGDNALLGRGSSDVVLVEDEKNRSSSTLVRSGKYVFSGNDNIPVTKNDGRSFLQVSSFELENVSTGKELITKEVFENINTKTYVQWTINNLNTTGTTFDGVIKFYNLSYTNSDSIKVSNITAGIDILYGQPFSPVYKIDFTGKTFEETTKLINTFIKGVNDGVINIEGYPTFFIDNQFPFFYGPDQITYNYVIDNVVNSVNNIPTINNGIKIFNSISLSDGYTEKGYGLVWVKTPPKLGILPNINIEEVNKRDYIVNPITYSILGGDKVYLLSHRSIDKYRIDLKDTLYGIPQDMLATTIYENTRSTVRGEELIDLLRQIVSFVLGHVHPFPGKPPIQEYPSIPNGPSAEQILQMINNAENTILNQNIRIN